MAKQRLNKYLKDNFERGAIDHEIRVTYVDEHGNPHFYIHPSGVDGETPNFVAVGINSIMTEEKYKEYLEMSKLTTNA
jgi:hypothetical protein